jgi:hypothetical protein
MSLIFPPLAADPAAPVDEQGAGLLAQNPFTALHYRFGMLLGVDDFETAQGYALGKMRLHNAWLHGAGVIWGLGVAFGDDDELAVAPGLAVDGAGRELYLDSKVCVDLGRWYTEHKDDPAVANAFQPVAAGSARLKGDLQVVIEARACLTRQVPALASTCEGAYQDTAYSRVSETVTLTLRPIPAADPEKAVPFRRVRVLLGLRPPYAGADTARATADLAVMDRRAQVLALPRAQQAAAALDAFHLFAALDEIELGPWTGPDVTATLLPAPEDTVVALADVRNIQLDPAAGGGFTLVAPTTAPAVTMDVSVRPTQLPTALLPELVLGAGLPAADAGGPRVTSAKRADAAGSTTLTLVLDRKLAPKSVAAGAFTVTTFTDADGWKDASPAAPAYDETGDPTITLTITPALATAALARVVARGTGSSPLLGAAPRVPLAGGAGDPPASAQDGRDFAFMATGS